MTVLKKKATKAGSKRSVSRKNVAKPKKQATVKKGTPPKQPTKAKKGVSGKKGVIAKRPVATPKPSIVQPKPVVPQPAKKVIPLASKPSSQTCPLVLDGIILIEDFSPRECFSCDEFDCRFYSAEERSGPLGSRLFVGGEDDEEGDEWGFPGEGGEDPGEADDWGDVEDE